MSLREKIIQRLDEVSVNQMIMWGMMAASASKPITLDEMIKKWDWRTIGTPSDIKKENRKLCSTKEFKE